MHALNEYLLTRHEEGRQVVVFVEESQSMPIATLEEIRLLSNLETRQHKLLQIILFGQPELDENLRKPEIRQLRDRITNSFALTPLTQAEVKDYVSFRLRAAGYHGPDLFPPQVIRYIWKETGGLTRRINIVADKALLAAYAANTHNVSLGHVQAAVADSAFSNAGRPAGAAWAKWAVAVLAAVMLAAVVGAGLDHYLSSATPSRSREAAHWSPSPNLPAPAAAAALPTAPSPSAQVAVTDPGSPDAAPVPRPQAATPAGASNQAPVPATNRGSRGDGNLLEQRLLATERWLAEERGGVFSIQLLGSNDAQMLRSYLDTLSNYIEKDKIFVYRTVANREPSMTVLYGAFPARADAVKSMEALPPALKANRPYIRTVQGIRAELALTKSSSRERDSMATDTGKKYRAVALTQASGPRG
jgi:septal ring-binding cell division protein DamX